VLAPQRIVLSTARHGYGLKRLIDLPLAWPDIDAYQGRGIGSALMRHIAALGHKAGLKELVADVLADNVPMLNVFGRSGLQSPVPSSSNCWSSCLSASISRLFMKQRARQ
jgi:GNAT superfamily N-acetyltransferase